jgi:hypothetical protein
MKIIHAIKIGMCFAALCLPLRAAAKEAVSTENAPVEKTSSAKTTANSCDALLAGTFDLLPEWRGVHPRLFTDTKELASAIKAWKENPQAFAGYFPDDKTLNAPPSNLDEGENAINDSILLARIAVALRITGDPKYAAALERWIPKLREMKPIGIPHLYKDNKDLSAGHFLLGMAIVYDVLKGTIAPADEAVIRTALIAQAQKTHDDLLALPGYPYEQNHFSIPLCGLAIASMALADEMPQAKAWGVYSRNTLSRCLAAVAHDGWFFEGISYWSFTMQFPVAYAGALKRLTGEDLLNQPPFRDTTAYVANMFLPGGNFAFDFSDWGPRRNADDTFQKGYDWPWHTYPTRINLFILYELEHETKDPFLANLANLLGGYDDLKSIDKVFFPLWQVKLPQAPVPLKNLAGYPPYHYFSDMEVVHWRNNWSDSNATALAFKSGPPAGHHIAALYPLYPDWKPALGHAHPDAGSFILFSKGVFLANDTGYTGKKESADHNCILVDGIGQYKGGQWSAFNSAPYEKYNKIRMTNVWLNPHVAASTALYRDAYDDALKLTECRRDLIMLDGKWMLIRDDLASAIPHVYEWRLHSDNEARPDGGQRWIMDNGPARLVTVCLTPISAATVGQTIVETEFFVPGRQRPQQRGFHLALSSPKQKNFEFLTALFIQSTNAPAECLANNGQDGRVELSAGKERCALWIGAGQSLQGDWAFTSYDANALASIGFSGQSFVCDGLKLTLSAAGNVALTRNSSGTWKIESASPGENEVRIETTGHETQVLRFGK